MAIDFLHGGSVSKVQLTLSSRPGYLQQIGGGAFALPRLGQILRILWLGLSLAAAPWPRPAGAWGDQGHKIVCEIAFQELDAAARDRVKGLMRIDPEFRYFSSACVWPDHPRQRADEHFINLPRTAASVLSTDCPMSERCLFSAIEDELRVLADDNASEQTKLMALKFLGHWVGDIHQPLHVAFEDDRGGNAVGVDGQPELSLHKVWDSEIIASGLRGSVREIAVTLRRGITPTDRAAWAGSGPADWAQESFAIATDPTLGYCIRRARACWYGPDTPRFAHGMRQRTVPVDQRYLDDHLPIAIERLKMAGVRLADRLEEALIYSPIE